MRYVSFRRSRLPEICKKEDIIFLGIFGSFARGEATKKSNIDILVRFSKSKSLLEIVRIERELGVILRRKVDLLTEMAISPYLIDRIKREVEVIYGG